MTTTEPRKYQKYDWPTLKRDYVEGIEVDGKLTWPTFNELSERHGVWSSNVRDRAAIEMWTTDRAAFQRRIEMQRQQARSQELAALGADLDLQALRIAKNGLTITSARLGELGQAAQERMEAIRQAGGKVTAETPKPVDSEELGTLSRAAVQWYALGSKALGDDQRMRLDVEVAAEIAVEATVRDQRTVGIMAILADINKLEPGVEDVIDVAGGRLQVAPGGDEDSPGPAADAEGQQVHPDDALGEQPEPQAERLPAAG